MTKTDAATLAVQIGGLQQQAQAINLALGSLTFSLKEIYGELHEIKESLKTEQLPSCEFEQA